MAGIWIRMILRTCPCLIRVYGPIIWISRLIFRELCLLGTKIKEMSTWKIYWKKLIKIRKGIKNEYAMFD